MLRDPKFWYRLTFYCLIYYAALLPWQVQWLPATLAIMVAALFGILAFDFKTKFKRLSSNSYASLMFISYLFVVVGSIYSPESKEAGKEVFSKLPLLAWPLLLGSMPQLSREKIENLLRIFILSSALAILVSFAYGFYRFLSAQDSSVFYFNELLVLLKVPAHYMGMYITFAYALVLQRWIEGRPLFKRQSLNLFLLFVFAR